MKKYLLFCLSLGLVTFLWAQERTVTGTVTDSETGEPVPGANVVEKGTSNGTITDFDGNYQLAVSEGATLVFSFVGYAPKEVAVGARGVVDVALEMDVQSLSEVVVIGYGQIEAEDATGAVSSVKAEDFNQGVISSPEQLIQGKSAGVQITAASGEPGAGINIRIRGTSSVRGGNNPLFVIDGVPLSGFDVSGGGQDVGRGMSSAKNPLNFLNPNDIASIDILKDASATAIYGSRGANGVVLITTKSGKGLANQPRLEYTGQLSVSHTANRFDLLGREEFLQASGAQDHGADTDWQDEIFRTAISNNHALSYSNGYNSGDYRVSLSYADQNGIVEATGLERITGRINWNQRFLDDKLTFSTQTTFSNVQDEATLITDNAGFEGDLLGSAYMANPTWESDADFQPSNTNANPNSILKYYDDNTATNRWLINLGLGYDITDDLSVKLNTGFDRSNAEREGGFSPELLLNQGIQDNGRAFIVETETASDLVEFFANYNKDFGDVKLDAVLGYSYQRFERSGTTILGYGFENQDIGDDIGIMIDDLRSSVSSIRGVIDGDYQQFLYDPADGLVVNRLFPTTSSESVPTSGINSLASSVTENTFREIDELQSYFGRVNLNILERYLITATLRADGSTKFGTDNAYGYFPSAALAWRISEEEFLPEFFDNMKFRLGYGITGNQEIPHNLHQSRVRYSAPGIDAGGNANSQLDNVAFENPDLQWEQTSQTNIGLDIGIFNGRLSTTLDWYRKVTTDLLIRINSAQPAPQPFIFQNLDADVVNQGIEVTLNYVAVDNGDFALDFNANAAYNENEVQNFQGLIDTGLIRGQGLTGAFAQRIAEGQPLFAYFLREFTGYNDEGIATYGPAGDQQIFVGKSPIPKWNVGFSANASYKNWDFSAYLNGQLGFWIYNNTANAFFTAGSINGGRNVTEDVLTSGEEAANAPDVSTRFLEKGDFLRMQNLAIGYTFDLPQESFINNLRISANAQNLFVITDYSGLDPEVSTNAANDQGVPSLNIDYTAYPRPRTYTLGVSASF